MLSKKNSHKILLKISITYNRSKRNKFYIGEKKDPNTLESLRNVSWDWGVGWHKIVLSPIVSEHVNSAMVLA